MWVKFIVSLLKHLNNQKYNHNKGLCKKNEYCKGSFIINENTVLWIGQNAQYTWNQGHVLDHVATVQKVTVPTAYQVIFQIAFK